MAPAAPPSPQLSLHDAVALSGRFPLLAGVDLEVARGETVLVEGPNGAGKTSLLRVCAGLVPAGLRPGRPCSGSTRCASAAGCAGGSGCSPTPPTCTTTSPCGRTCASPCVPPGATPAGSTAPVSGWGSPAACRRPRAAKLSAGQRRRVALAVLAARWPELWLLDEPHAGLDAVGPWDPRRAHRRGAAAGATVVVASHEAEFGRAAGHPGGHHDRGSGDRRAVPVVPGRSRVGGAGDPPAPVPPAPDGRSGRRAGGPCGVTPLLVAGKDLRIEARSRVALSQVAPFGIVALVMFAFALGPDRALMAKGAPGLFWVAVLFCTVLAVQRSVSVESADGARDGLRLSGIDPAGLFLGKAAAVAVQLVVLEVVLGVGVVLLYGATDRASRG